ncbi:hypothetical protein [Pseudomonas sp.]|uniref:hypothetical protein n=1 Tax=Pseudomonas sp. TaxID=306 RepID=UPI0025851517|nr:hypothetical protein [Pseudomonas sp.]
MIKLIFDKKTSYWYGYCCLACGALGATGHPLAVIAVVVVGGVVEGAVQARMENL